MLRTTVTGQIAGSTEGLSTAGKVTRVWGACEMNLEMRHQLLAACEHARAVCRRATDLAHCVQLPVARQIAGRAEALATFSHRTLVGLLSRVRLEMFVERELAVEATAAVRHRTGKRSVLGRSRTARRACSARWGGTRIGIDVDVGTRGEIGNGTALEIGMRVMILVLWRRVLDRSTALQVERGIP